ncbi:MAG: SRPBCC domain-containing protein [Polyangiales bacterium]
MDDLGTLLREGNRYVLRYERRYPHPSEKVWRALVEPEELRHWFPARIEGERRAGARLSFVFDGDEGPPLEGEVRVFEPPRVLEYTWDDEVLRWELHATREGCLLVFTTTFQARAKAPRDAAGWHMCLANLVRALGDAPAETPPWAELYESYCRTLGIGDYPDFVKHGAHLQREVLGVAGLDGYAFEGRAGARLVACHASRDASGDEQKRDDESYLMVLEGELALHLGETAFTLQPGVEFVVPAASPIRVRVQAGTRLIYGYATQT